MKTLIADHSEADRNILQELLQDYSECDQVDNGKEALTAFLQAWRGNEPYDLVCLGVQMSVLDGIKTLKMLREMEETMKVGDSRRCRVFLITSDEDVLGPDVVRSRKHDAYFRKPILESLFLNRLRTCGLFT